MSTFYHNISITFKIKFSNRNNIIFSKNKNVLFDLISNFRFKTKIFVHVVLLEKMSYNEIGHRHLFVHSLSRYIDIYKTRCITTWWRIFISSFFLREVKCNKTCVHKNIISRVYLKKKCWSMFWYNYYLCDPFSRVSSCHCTRKCGEQDLLVPQFRLCWMKDGSIAVH